MEVTRLELTERTVSEPLGESTELELRRSYIADLLESLGFSLEFSSIKVIGAYGEMAVATRTR